MTGKPFSTGPVGSGDQTPHLSLAQQNRPQPEPEAPPTPSLVERLAGGAGVMGREGIALWEIPGRIKGEKRVKRPVCQ